MNSKDSIFFKQRVDVALADPTLQQALNKLQKGMVSKRAKAVEHFPEFEALRTKAKKMKDHTLAHLDHYLLQYEQQVVALGGVVHWAQNATEANKIISSLCKKYDAQLITKSKSMLTEEIKLNDFLAQQGFKVIETDLGEYILQLLKDHPSHIVVPAIHILKETISDSFKTAHQFLDNQRDLSTAQSLLNEARLVLRDYFQNAQVGITGANFLIAENGMAGLVTNEGNADLTQIMTNTQIVVAGIEKVVPTFNDAAILMRLLARSATGQPITAYTTFSSGPRKQNERSGPTNYHVVLVDNGRSEMLKSSLKAMLRCIRCGACMNHCPVYQSVGGKAYGSVYPGPMGAVLTPSLIGLNRMTKDLPNASTFCGRCNAVCPVKIPLTDLMREFRVIANQRDITPKLERLLVVLWSKLSTHAGFYHIVTMILNRLLYWCGSKKGYLKWLPFTSAWTKYRRFPSPQKGTFLQQWNQYKHERR